MSIKLMPNQTKLIDILLFEEQYIRRKNKILLGKPQVGKTILAKHLPSIDNGLKYINFTEKYLEDFLEGKFLNDITFNNFLNFLRVSFNKDIISHDRIILDEIDSVIVLITKNDTNLVLTLYKQMLDMDLTTEFIFVSSIFDNVVENQLIIDYKSRVNIMNFTEEDKKHIIKYNLNNIPLFELKKINNLRQLLIT